MGETVDERSGSDEDSGRHKLDRAECRSLSGCAAVGCIPVLPVSGRDKKNQRRYNGKQFHLPAYICS